GIIDFNLSRAQVETRNFGSHTLAAIHVLESTFITTNRQQTLDLLLGLSQYQIAKMRQAENFGTHTVKAIEHLREQNENLNNSDTLAMVRGLKTVQVRGMIYHGLSVEQVKTPKFGDDIMWGIDDLLTNNPNMTDQEAFEMLRELDFDQVSGIVDFELNRAQVQSDNFGKHILEGMDYLQDLDNNIPKDRAYSLVIGLHKLQIKALIDFKLDLNFIKDKMFSEALLKTMHALKVLNPKADSKQLYSASKEIQEYQARGIIDHQLTLEQVGLETNTKGGFESIKEDDPRYAKALTGAQLDSYAFLLEIIQEKQVNSYAALEATIKDQKVAYENALQLNTKQTAGMVDFGLSLEQVKHPAFTSNNKILEELASYLVKENHEFRYNDSKSLSAENTKEAARNWIQSKIQGYEGLTDLEKGSRMLLALRNLTIPRVTVAATKQNKDNVRESITGTTKRESDNKTSTRKGKRQKL
uniref:hypothetical protein n=1 Tax=Ascidiimonas meishanensis TaxID=3128903 RepID=UPI0030EE3F1C